MSEMRPAAAFLNLSDCAPGSPPFDVTAYWADVIAKSAEHFRDEVQRLLSAPKSKASASGEFPHCAPAAVMDEIRNLKLPSRVQRLIVHVLAGARGAREHYEALGRQQPGRAPNSTSVSGARRGAETDDQLGIVDDDLKLDDAKCRSILRAAQRWPRTASQRMVDAAGAWLTFRRQLARLLPQLLRGSGGRPEKLYVKLCAMELAMIFRESTGSPHHGLVGRLMLRAEVFGDSPRAKACRPWDSMAPTSVRCRAKTGGFCRHPCRRVDALVRQGERRLVTQPARKRNPVT